MTKTAIVFPGQGSQQLGMLADLADHPIVKQVYKDAEQALGYDLWDITQNDEEKLSQTQYTQPAILAASYALWLILKDQVGEVDVMAGHSLGEYTALLAAGAISFEDAVRLVGRRGELMQQAVPEGTGAMAAIIGLDDDAVIKACADAAHGEIVAAVNFNSPGQVVISGEKDAVERAMLAAKEAGAKRALPLPVSVPSHCALMKPAADQLLHDMKNLEFQAPQIAVLNNVDAQSRNSVDEILNALHAQLHQPVLWVDTIEAMANMGIERVIECGPGKVLSGLGKRINKELQYVAYNNGEDLNV